MTKKKILLCLLIGAMAMSFASCNENANDDESDEDTAVITTAPNDESDVETTTTTTAPTTTTTATTTQTPVKTPEREREEIEDKIMRIFGKNTDEAAEYFKKVFADKQFLTLTEKYDSYENCGGTYVYKNTDSCIKFLDIPWSWANMESRTNDDYVYRLAFEVGTYGDTISDEFANTYAITESEADSYYFSAYNKLVEMYGEPTDGNEDFYRWCVWDNTIFGSIYLGDHNFSDRFVVALTFTDPNFDRSTIIEKE